MEGLERLRIMMISANAHEYRASGPTHDAFVTKPVELQPLLERIAELLPVAWIREPLVRELDTAALTTPPPRPSPGSRHHFEDLYRLGRMGHVRGIEAKLRELELDDPSSEPVAAQLRALVANFDLKRYMNVLEALRVGA
jgi:hypothetical protein